MPSIMIHAKVGYEIGKVLHAASYDYYLGLLAPDAPNLNGFAPKEERWPAHIRRKDLNEWREALREFYLINKKNYNSDFLLGYYVHILTDIVFDDYFYKKIRKQIMKENYSKQEAHEVMNKDMYEYDFNEFEQIKKTLENNQVSYNINNVTKDLLSAWKDKIVNSPPKENKRRYVTEKIIKSLTNKVYKELIDGNIF